MATKKVGGKGKASPSAEKCNTIEDDRTRQEEISDFLKKFKNFADVPVKDLRHIISLFLMEVYSNIYGQYSRKVRGLWANRPDDWPHDLPFVDPNNKMKGEGQNKNCKPKKDTCVQMLQFLYKKYQANRGILFAPIVRPKPDPLISTSQDWRTDTCDDSIQLPTYADYFGDSSSRDTTPSELSAAVSSIGEPMSAYAVSESGSEQKWNLNLLHVDDSTNSMFHQLSEHAFTSPIAVECATENDETAYVVDGGAQYVNIHSADYETNFVDLSQYSGNPLVDTNAFCDLILQQGGVSGRQGIVFNNSNCTTTNKGGIVKPQQVVESELVSENCTHGNELANKLEMNMNLFSKEERLDGEQGGEKNTDVQKFDAKINARAPVQEVDDCDDPFEWDPLVDSEKRIVRKLLSIQSRRLVQDSVYELLNNAYLFFRGELDEMGPKADYSEKERLVGRAHTLEGCLDISLHFKLLPLEYEEKLKNFVKPATEEVTVTQIKVTSKNGLEEETNLVSQKDIACVDNAAGIDPADLNIKCRKVAVTNQSLPFPEIVRRPVQQADDTVLMQVESGCKDSKKDDAEMYAWFDGSSETEFLNSLMSCGSFSNEIALKEDDFKKETPAFIASRNRSSSEKEGESSGSLQQCTSGYQQSEPEQSYSLSHQESQPLEAASSLHYSTLNENGMYPKCHENNARTPVPFNAMFQQQQQSYQVSEVSDVVRGEQCTDQWTYASCMASPRTDIVRSLEKVSLNAEEPSSSNVPRMWQSESYRLVVNESSGGMAQVAVGTGAQPSMTDFVIDRPIVRGILTDKTGRVGCPGGKRKLHEEIEVDKTPPAPIPTCVSDANLDDPHFSSHYRKKVKTVMK